MLKVYVAHPYGGEEKNKLSVEKIVLELTIKNSNILYISPIHALGYLYTALPYQQGMEYCYELLSTCDELLLCDGWEKSVGCMLEWHYADEHHIPIRYHIREVLKSLDVVLPNCC